MSNGYDLSGKKICKAKTITVPKSVQKRSIKQYVYAKAEEMEREFKLGYSEDSETPFEVYAESWLVRQAHYAPSTLAGYTSYLKVCNEFIGQIPIGKIKPIAIEGLCTELRKRIHRGRLVSEQTVQKYLGAVSVVLSDAKRNEIIQRNPAKMVRLPKIIQTEQKIPSTKEMKYILDVILYDQEPYRTFTLMALYLGLRRGELCALKWTDIKENTMYVSRSRSYVREQGIVEGKTKNGKTRIIPLDDFMLLQLQRLFERCMFELGVFCNRDYIFLDNDRNAPHPDTFSKHFRKRMDEFGCGRAYHLHTLSIFMQAIFFKTM